MTTPYISEIRIMSFGFAPRGWAQCDGQLVQISQNPTLYSLIGTTYGGDGVTTFGLPNLQARAPMHVGNGHPLAQLNGTAAHTLTMQEVPPHSHIALGATSAADTPIPAGNYLGAADNFYAPLTDATATPLPPATVGTDGGSTGHENRQPLLVLNFCIALQGIIPPRN